MISRPSTPGRPAYESYEKKEKCAVVGIWGARQTARLAYLSLYAQQHRGQESSGICVSSGTRLTATTGMGLVTEVFSELELNRLEALGGKGAIGHNRYSTAGGCRPAGEARTLLGLTPSQFPGVQAE